MRFRTVELDIVRPGSVQPAGDPGWGSVPWGALTQLPDDPEHVDTLRYSDAGFVDENHVPYPPYVTQALDLSRSLTLSADALGGSYSIGTLDLANPGGVLDAVVETQVNDHLPVRIWHGVKSWDAARQVWRDPVAADVVPVFAGLGKNWQPGLGTLSVTLLDATYWLETAAPVQMYTGTGRLDGDSNVVGRSMPRLRGHACNLTPVLIDSVSYVYQVSDGPADVLALYEGGFGGGIIFGGLVADIYAASPEAGAYTVQSSPVGTWLRLGTKPVYGITVDAFGRFRSGRAPEGVLDILRQVLVEDLVMPSAFIDPAWQATSSILPASGGWFWDGSQAVTGRDVVSTLLSGLGVSLVPTRIGTLLPVQLHVPDADAAPVLEITPDMIVGISAVALDASLDPPTWRWRIGWQHNYTVQTTGSGLHPQASADRQSLIGQADRAAVWFDTGVKSSWRVPSDPALITTALASRDDAQGVANTLGALWGKQRHLWAVDIPQELAFGVELGDPVTVRAPLPGAASAVPGTVIGEHVSSSSLAVTLTILV